MNCERFSKKAKTLLDLVVDSTGLKGYGEGEWKIKVHDKDGIAMIIANAYNRSDDYV